MDDWYCILSEQTKKVLGDEISLFASFGKEFWKMLVMFKSFEEFIFKMEV